MGATSGSWLVGPSISMASIRWPAAGWSVLPLGTAASSTAAALTIVMAGSSAAVFSAAAAAAPLPLASSSVVFVCCGIIVLLAAVVVLSSADSTLSSGATVIPRFSLDADRKSSSSSESARKSSSFSALSSGRAPPSSVFILSCALSSRMLLTYFCTMYTSSGKWLLPRTGRALLTSELVGVDVISCSNMVANRCACVAFSSSS